MHLQVCSTVVHGALNIAEKRLMPYAKIEKKKNTTPYHVVCYGGTSHLDFLIFHRIIKFYLEVSYFILVSVIHLQIIIETF